MEHSPKKKLNPMHYSINDNFPLYSIFIFILIALADFILNILPCNIITIISNNIYLKHFIGFLTMVFFVVIVVPLSNKKLNNILSKSALMYIIFLFVAKTEPQFFIPIIILMGILYLLFLKKEEYISNDISNENHNKINIIILINNSISLIILCLLIIGFVLYLGRKKYEYGENFIYITFLFGSNICNETVATIGFRKSLQHVLD